MVFFGIFENFYHLKNNIGIDISEQAALQNASSQSLNSGFFCNILWTKYGVYGYS